MLEIDLSGLLLIIELIECVCIESPPGLMFWLNYIWGDWDVDWFNLIKSWVPLDRLLI